MAALTIRKLDDALKIRLRIVAAHHGRSMEEEAREILRSGLSSEPAREMNLAASLRRHVEALGGIELELPAREPTRPAPDFGE